METIKSEPTIRYNYKVTIMEEDTRKYGRGYNYKVHSDLFEVNIIRIIGHRTFPK